PRALRAHLGGAGLQDPHGIDGEQPAHRRPPAGQQVHLRPDAAGHRPRRAAGAPARPVSPGRRIRGGDIIVFKYPEEPDRDFIKRVIGLPGETIELINKKVQVNGTPLDEPYVHFLTPATGEYQEATSYDVRERFGPVTVPPNQYFVMGDNRDNSQDSRYWGFLPRDYVKG